jgi:hypothetical protein
MINVQTNVPSLSRWGWVTQRHRIYSRCLRLISKVGLKHKNFIILNMKYKKFIFQHLYTYIIEIFNSILDILFYQVIIYIHTYTILHNAFSPTLPRKLKFFCINSPFSIFPTCLCSNISLSPAYHTYIPELIRYARACWTYDHAILKWRHATVNEVDVKGLGFFVFFCFFFLFGILVSQLLRSL